MKLLLTLFCLCIAALNLAPSARRQPRSLHLEVIAAAERYAEANPEIASPYRGHDGIYTLASSSGNLGHAFYFASGGDFFRLLIDFPTTKHLHFVDVMAGWGPNPQYIVDELKARMSSLPNAKLKLIHGGFVKEFGREVLSQTWTEAKLVRYLKRARKEEDAERYGPAKWSLSWDSECCGRIERSIYLHFANAFDEQEVISLFEPIPDDDYVDGLISVGVSRNLIPAAYREVGIRGHQDTVVYFERYSAKPLSEYFLRKEVDSDVGNNMWLHVADVEQEPEAVQDLTYPLVVRQKSSELYAAKKILCSSSFRRERTQLRLIPRPSAF